MALKGADERVLALLQEARRQLELERSRREEPIAIVGIGCRFPGGVTNPSEFWSLLQRGVDASGDVPADRWSVDAYYDPDPDAAGKAYTRRGSFLERIDGFEPEFFGISPREALGMDPQQRLLLEVVWESLEDAGIAPEQLRGSATGVWLGLCVEDYARRSLWSEDPAAIDAYSALGNTRSVAAGRISYVLDLRGPTVQLDTACSSSLVALHQACQSLRVRECNLALAGGVNLMSAPESMIALCKLRALAVDGRCKTFDAAADGYGRGEGCAVVALKRLSDARAAGDHIYAVVRGSAINHDGHSNGLTAPNGLAQEAVLQAALANAGVEPQDVSFVEAHGTGTLIGDPIEVLALSRVYGVNRPAGAPLQLGTVKTNFGHLEGAAGVAGLIKVALCLAHAELAPNLHFHRPNPKIHWSNLPVAVVTKQQPWPRSGKARVAGVSSFGISGTNAHVVLEEAPSAEAVEGAPERAAELVVLSAKTPEGLRAAAGRLKEHLEEHVELALGDVAYSLVTTRSLHEQRLSLSVATRGALLEGLEGAAQGETPRGAQRGVESVLPGKVAWLFTGQGAQQLGMGRELYGQWGVFREALEEVFGLFEAELEVPLREVMWAEPGTARAGLLDETGYTQPALFALEWALAKLWQSWGAEPELVLGHSIGGITAAAVAGVMSLPDAVKLVGARARLMQALPKGGAMVSLGASEQRVREALRPYAATVSLAAINGPSSVVIAGQEADVVELAESLARAGVQTKRLTVSHAFHSALMEPMLGEYRKVAETIGYGAPRIGLVSDTTGELAGAEVTTAEYWVRHVRETVRFAPAVEALAGSGAGTYVELGPRGTLLGLVGAVLGEREAVLLSSLRAGRPEPEAVLEALGGWVARGGRASWPGVFPEGGQRVALPTYAWQRERYWVEASRLQRSGGTATGHPLLGARIAAAGADAVYESVLSVNELPWLADHLVAGHVVVPAAALAELVRAAAADQAGGRPKELTNLLLQTPLILQPSKPQRVQVVLSEQGTRAAVYSQLERAAADAQWQLHATSELAAAAAVAPARLDLAALRARCPERLDVGVLYATFRELGLEYGPAFQRLQWLWRGAGEVLAEVTLDGIASAAYGVHPALLDAALQAVAGLLTVTPEVPLLPFALGRFAVHQPGATSAFVRARLLEAPGADTVVAQVTLLDAEGGIIAEVDPLTSRLADFAALARPETERALDAFYRLDWESIAAPAVAAAVSGRWRVVASGDSLELSESVANDLRSRGASVDVATVALLAGLPPVDHLLAIFGPQTAADAATRMGSDVLAIAQTAIGQPTAPRLWWLTRSAVSLSAEESVAPASALVWGVGRSLMQEHPALRCTLIDVEHDASPSQALLAELGAEDGESQLAWRGGKRHAARLVRAAVPPTLPQGPNYQLQARRKGTLDSLALSASERRAPAAGEVEIEVVASGLNFRDVLNALGMYPGEAGPLGGECSGRVTAVGPGVSRWSVGDAVMALTGGTFQRFVTADARTVARVPSGMTLEQAATVPVVFLTAWYALHDLARLQPTERILIHAAAGGVGMAAVQLAQWIGAEVLGTASPSKWQVVRGLGVQHIASSRDLSFVPAFRSGAGGADVVLNSLAGEFIDASLSLLSRGGRFVEMGKADLREAARVASTHPGVEYVAFDLAAIDPDRIAEMLTAICRGFESGQLTPLPVRSFPITEAESAFRFMAQARHVGKIALRAERPLLRLHGTALITGGLGALGLEVARDFARRGVQRLLLTGRRGMETPGAEAAVAELRALGAEVTVAAVDVADRSALAELLAAIPEELPLRAVVHAAGVLDDGLLAEQTPERFRSVIAPKALGAWHLHELTERADLDLFVLFSSLAGTLGSAGQSSYAGANAFLDGLAAQRRAQGRPALSLAWGPWSESGFAARLDRSLQARFARQGIGMISPTTGRALFDAALSRSESHLVAALLDLRVLAKSLGDLVPPLWRSLVRAPLARSSSSRSDWTRELAALPPAERVAALRAGVQAEVARVLSLSKSAQVPLDKPLKELGLDSLMAVELRNALGQRAGVSIPATLAFDYPTPEAITQFLLTALSFSAPVSQPMQVTAPALDEPIAIVGIGCRFPGGANDVASFWRLLEQGVDAITEVPKERWDIDDWYDPDPDAVGKMTTRWGGFLRDLERFEPSFFGISPREAVSIDPQERLLLETTWEALESAGIPPHALMGSATGVYMGLCGTEYQNRVMADANTLDAYSFLGTAHSTIVGRLSYWLGLKGPNLPVDTACSSSLVTVHLACQALRSRECELALVGGANVLLNPEGTVYFSRLKAMSPTGRCHSFSADADGYVRAEGAGVVVLERLSDARKNGHRVLALVRGSAINQDGRSNGLTAPNGPSQQMVIREALARGGVAPQDVGYVECHGTGTALGDPIEVQALGAVLGPGRSAGSPVVLGALKSNVGHMEGAAGVGGLIKTVLALQHGRIPKSLHFTAPNPHIAWSELPVRVASEALDWPRSGKARVAGVSSFGISGTNAHVVLEEAPSAEAVEGAPERAAELVVLSAKTPEGLRAAAGRLKEHLEEHVELALGDVAYSLVTTRSLHEQRLSLSVATRGALLEGLEGAAQGETPRGAQRGVESVLPGKVAWLFTGQGAQQLGMGRELYGQWGVFREALEEVFGLFEAELEVPLREVMWAEPGTARAGLLDETGYTQPALFALEWALAKLWQSWGAEPKLVLGHSIGGLTAAAVAGVMSLPDAVKLVGARARLMQALPKGGAMVSLGASEQRVREALRPYAATVSLAAINGPSSVVIAGQEADVVELAESLARAGVQTKRLTVSHAFHSALMEPMLGEYRKVAETIGYGAPRIGLVSDTTGELAGAEVTTAEYWVRHVRETVRFAPAVEALAGSGAGTYVELGPRGTLLGLVGAVLGEREAVLLSSLRAGRPEPEAVLEALGGWVARGGRASWPGVFPEGGQRVALPTYAWQRERYWVEASRLQRSGGTATGHPLLGARIAAAGADAVYETLLSASEPAWLSDHRVGGHVVVPAAALAELVRAAAEDYAEGVGRVVSSLTLQAPLLLAQGGAQRVQIVLTGQGTKVAVHSQLARGAQSAPWVLHASADLSAVPVAVPKALDLSALRRRCGQALDVASVYASFAALGLDYGPVFQGLKELRRGPDEALAELTLGDASAAAQYGVHPALLDAALQAVAGALATPGEALLPFELGRFVVYRPGASQGFVHVRLPRAATGQAIVADLVLTDAQGEVFAQLDGLQLRRADVAALGRPQAAATTDAFYRLAWQPASAEIEAVALQGRWLVVAQDGDARAHALATALEAQGAQSEVVSFAQLSGAQPAEQVICFWEPVAALAAAQQGLAVVQALSRWQPAARLWWVTRGAVAVEEGEESSPAAAALWGLGRTVMTEQPELGCTLLDVEPSASAELVLRELCATDDESQVAWRKGQRHVARLVRATRAPELPASADYQLVTEHQGALDSLTLVEAARREPRAGEVEIQVQATGLNFRDVLNALGMYPGEAGPLGGECSGVVTALGAGVSGVSLGDRVMGIAAGTFRRFVTADARCVTSIPAGLSFAEAASVPIAFLTAWYALHDLAQLKRGERVLIHAAAGGVGMAAVQLAQWIGAEVLATASPGKWDILRSLGVEQVASSRDQSFAEAFRSGGADVVLNALTGDFIDASLALLSEGGRFIEMGKADLRDPAALERTHPGLSYQAFDLTQVSPDRIAQMLSEVKTGIESGRLRPLPLRTFRVTEAEAAFRFMARARHVGKLVVLPPPELSHASTVLITGGLGALGLAVARRLAERGVGHLVLTGRRGQQTPGIAPALAGLEALGAAVRVVAVDVTDRAALAAVIAAIPAEQPLRGVVHAAGLLDDGLLAEQTPERFAGVLGPKVLGAQHLDELTRHQELDFFVLFSSLAGTLGSAAQGGYAAANAFLDALAAQRRALGLPATSLAWGPWAESGMAAALEDKLRARFARQGISMLSTEAGLALFERALRRPEPQLVVVPLDLRALSKALGGAVPAVWRSLVRAAPQRSLAERTGWSRELSALPASERLEAVTEVVRGEVARVLSLAASAQVPRARPLQELGLDSLMAVELRNTLGRRAGVTLSATLAFDHPTPEAIAKYLLSEVLEPSALQASATVAAATVGSSDEPIAIVGIGCRFPGGVTDPESFWRLLGQGVDAVTEVPKDRWDIDAWYDPDPDAAGKMTTRWGGFLADLTRFEPSFFGISPREAVSIDPQGRLLLETTWEALEDAGIRAETLLDSQTGVYMGLCGSEYQNRLLADPAAIDAYGMIGTAHSTIVGRLSYWLGLKGPNMPIDTACSSSLVAVHLACQALRNGECELALAGGANVILDPEGTIYFSRLRAMSPTGRCHTFSADADGYVRSEGAGVVVLERLSEARKRGHRVWAIVRGSAVNQDGRSNGLTAPSGPAQQAVITEALRRSGVDPAQVGYVECHGTGTALGDPIEVQALAAVLSAGRSFEQPVVLGSLKSNLGHMEGAAGVGGLIKAALTLQRAHIPQTLHFTRPNPHIPWSELPVQVASEARAWPSHGAPRIAGVSAFGISGTNAHVVLEEPPAEQRRAPPAARAAELVVLSAKTPEALSAAAGRMREHLEAHPELSLGDLAFNLVTTRSLHEQRLAFSVRSRPELLGALQAAAADAPGGGFHRGTAGASPRKLAWLFTGQGAQRLGMGRELHAEWPAFREAFDAACALLDPALDLPLREVMWAEAGSPRAGLLDQTGYTQPALFALEWALARLWSSWGVQPDVLFGHSIGELVAGAVAGIFSLPDAARLVAARARLMQALPAGGAMASVAAPEATVRRALQSVAASVSIAAVNGPSSVVISGSEVELGRVLERFVGEGVAVKRLSVSHAFHSPLMEPMLDEFRKVAQSIEFHAPTLPIVSNVSGELAGQELQDADYWVRQIREAVRFADGVKALESAGARSFLELGPRATLLGVLPATLAHPQALLLPALRAGRSEPQAVLEALGGWVTQGGAVDWQGVFPAGGRHASLPTYSWQRERYWIPARAPQGSGAHPEHPLLGVRVATAGAEAVYETLLSATEPEWLADHRVAGRVVVPAAALAEWVRAAAEDYAEGAAQALEILTLQAPLLISEGSELRVQVVLTEQGTRAAVFSQPARAQQVAPWTLHASGEAKELRPGSPAALDLEAIRLRCTEPLDVAALYASFAALGLGYGAAFQGLRALWRGEGEALAQLALGDGVDVAQYGVHPALLDAALQAVAGALGAPGELLLPFEFGRFALYQAGATAAWVHVRLPRAPSAQAMVADLVLADAEGKVLAELRGLQLRRADPAALGRPQAPAAADAFHRLDWQLAASELAATELAGRWLVVAERGDQAARGVAEALRAQGAQSEVVSVAELPSAAPAEQVVCFWNPSDALVAASQGLAVVRALVGREPGVRLWWVTRGAVALEGTEAIQPAAAALWGLGRTLMAEHPELGCKLVDIESDAAGEGLLRELGARDDESQVAWRQQRRHLARLVRAPRAQELPATENYQLVTEHKGALDSLSWVAGQRRSPQPGEVEIRVHAAGLNFRDVLNALGMYPGEAGPLGGECSGVVTAVGAGVTSVALGDRVMGLAGGAFRRFVTVDARWVTGIPSGLTFEEAASVPVAFLTAWYALHDLAGLQRGERVLIHAAAGGVGMAAVQVAQCIGAEVLGTASPGKWEVLRSLGIEHIASSRDQSFAGAFRAQAGGADVVLNALTGEFIDASLSLLSSGGRFIEMGKADLRDAAAVAAAHPGVRYQAFDLTELRVERIAELLAAVRQGLESGRLRPLPLRAFRVTEAEGAFRYMAQARHVGKVVLVPPPELSRATTVLITGGLGALGLAVARRLAERGVGHLVLTGRRGRATPGAAEAVTALEALGTEVTVAAVDVTDRAALQAVIAALPAERPLRGVVHAAGLVDDGLLVEQTPERFARVLAPKVLGARHLDELTRQHRLDFFVLFSSLAGTLGSAAQGGYAAANAFLDALAAQRRALGLAGQSLAWGPWAESGMAAALAGKLRTRFARQGISMLSTEAGLSLFERALGRPEAQLVVVPLDLRVLTKALGGAIPSVWRSLVRASAQRPTAGGKAWSRELSALPAAERLAAVTEVVRGEVARVLSLSTSAQVPGDRPLQELGMDSLMAVELRNALGRRAGVTLSAALAFEHPTPEAMAQYLLAEVLAVGESNSAAAGMPPASESETNGVPQGADCERLNRPQHTRARLFCFHDAGGSASMFLPFVRLESAGIEVHTISQVRHTRAADPASAQAYLRTAVDYIRSHSDLPYALFGHSLGSLFAARVLQELAVSGAPLPMLFVPSAAAPNLAQRISEGSDVRSALPHLLGQRAALVEKLPSFGEDFAADVARWLPLSQAFGFALDVPIAAFIGREDPLASTAEVEAWQSYTTRDFSLSVLPGGHGYIFEADLCSLLVSELSQALLRYRQNGSAERRDLPAPRRSTTTFW